MRMNRLIVVKIGGSVITDKTGGSLEVNEGNLKRLCREIAEAKNRLKCRLLLVHGAGPFGHVLAERYRLHEGVKGAESLRGMCETHASMARLNSAVVEELIKAGLNAISFQPSASGLLENRKLVSMELKAMKKMLALDLVPVGYGDVLLDVKTGINILSGDHLAPYLAVKLKASRIVIATDVSGIYNGDPKKNKNASLVREINKGNVDQIEISGSQGVDVTGGMKRKVMELLEAAGNGITSQVISGINPGELKAALLGNRELGTTIR